jgi:3-deoxy-manno-octulosonate cytidylyltransferase (CMP-KDO synthetase)
MPVKFTVVIPARYASSRFPGKPLADIGGKPMVVRVAERAAKSGAAEVLVATDDARIAEAVEEYGHTAVMTRADHVSGTDRLAEVAAQRKFGADRIVVNVQGDEPAIPPALIRQVAENLQAHRAAQVSTACHAIANAAELNNPNVVKVVFDADGYALYFSRAPIPYPRDAMLPSGKLRRLPENYRAYRHLGIYAYRASFLRAYARLKPVAIEQAEALEQLRVMAHGHRISVLVCRTAPHPGIDTPADLQRLRRLLRR